MNRALVPLGTSIALHAALAAAMITVAVRRMPAPQTALQIQVVDVPPPKPPEPAPPKPAPLKVARSPKAPLPPPTALPQPIRAPPPPTQEAPRSTPAPVIVTGITMESTSEGGGMAVGAGNTLRGAPQQTAAEPSQVKPYKAEKYAPIAQVTEIPQLLNRDSVNLRKYYPPQALKEGFEGDVMLRIVIDGDGSVTKIDIVSDPGQGLGAAAAEAVRGEYRFSPARVNGVPVATTVSFPVHFVIN